LGARNQLREDMEIEILRRQGNGLRDIAGASVANNPEERTKGWVRPFSGSRNHRGIQQGPDVFNGFSQGIEFQIEDPLDQTHCGRLKKWRSMFRKMKETEIE